MQLSCLQENLAEALASLSRVVPTRTTLPVLSNILLETEGGRLKLVANNLEMAMTCFIGAQIQAEGAITLPARVLSEYVGLLQKGQKIDLELDTRSRRVHLVCGRQEAHLAGIDAEDFPPVPSVSGESGFIMEAGLLKKCIGQVGLAAAQDDSRPVLAGVLVTVKDDVLTLAAADGFRLAVRGITMPDGTAPEELTMIVPARTLAEVARVLPDAENEHVQIAATPSQNQIQFSFGTIEVTGRLVEGQFPDYQRIIPQQANSKVVMGRADLLQATRAASVFARDNAMIVRLNIKPPEESLAMGQVVVSSSAAEIGDNTTELDASIDGDAMEVAFNGRYLREALDAIDTGQVTLQLTGPTSPGILRPVGPDADSYFHVVMPMHIAR
jgi:DNA polymerase-3 subunit beta